MNIKTFPLCLLTLLLTLGCAEPPHKGPPPTEEIFIALPYGLPIECGNAVRSSVLKMIEQAPVGTPITAFLADNQALLGSTTIPKGAPAYRRSVAKRELEKVFERLDPEMSGGSQDVDLIAVSASVRKYRKSKLKPKVIVIGSPLIIDREQGIAITNENIPCDGCVTDGSTSYGKMETFPEGTTLRFFTPRQDYGNGPNHRSQIEHFLRYLLQTKGAPLLCISSDADVVFNTTKSQWDDDVEAKDNCQGLKKVAADKPKTILYDADGKTEVIELKPDLAVKLRRPEPEHLPGLTAKVVFLIDTSGSVSEDADGNDCSEIFDSIKTDVCQKLHTMPCTHFAIVGFGGWKDLSPRISRFPYSAFSGLYWAEATRGNRDQAIEFVGELRSGGGTPTLAGLQAVAELEGPLTCITYSDGVPTLGDGGQSAVLEYAKELAEQEVVIQTVGVGALSARNKDFDWSGGEFLARLAKATAGEYFTLDGSL